MRSKRIATYLLALLALTAFAAPVLAIESTPLPGGAEPAEPRPVDDGDEPDWCSNGKGQPRTFDHLNTSSVEIHVNANGGASDAVVTVTYADNTTSGPVTVPQGQSDIFQSDPDAGNITGVSIESAEPGVQTCGTLDAESP